MPSIHHSRAKMLVIPLLAGVTIASAWLSPGAAAADDPALGLELGGARYRVLLGRPPAPGSRAEADDLAILRWNQRTRSPATIAESWSYLDRNPGRFSAAIGSDLLKGAPAVAQGLLAFMKRVDAVKDELKNQVGRPRSYVGHADLRPLRSPGGQLVVSQWPCHLVCGGGPAAGRSAA